MPQPQPSGAADIVSVYEVVNETQGELYVGTTWRLHSIEDFRDITPPKALRHWKGEDKLSFRTIDDGLPRADAPAFVEAYRRSPLVKKWRVLTEFDAQA